MRLLFGVLTSLALGLGLASTPAHARRADVDPAARAAFVAAAEKSYETGWRQKGGTWLARCDSVQGDSVQVVAWNPKTRIHRATYRNERHLPTVAKVRGRNQWVRTPSAVRTSLRVHRAPMSPPWVVSRSSASFLDRQHGLWPGDRIADDVDMWEDLTMTALPGGAKFVASDEWADGAGNVQHDQWEWVADDSGRFITARRHTEGVMSGSLDATCTNAWTWTRPDIKLPKKAGKHPNGRRYSWERHAVGRAVELVWQADQKLEAGATDAQVVAWLHGTVKPKQRTAHGIRFIVGPGKQKRLKPAVAFKVLVRDGKASYKPVR